MKRFLDLKNLYILSSSLILALFFLILANNESNWFSFWGSLSIPPQPPFSDLKAHIYYYLCFKDGINIYLNECNLIPSGGNKVTTHPQIWIYLVDFLNLENKYIYQTFIITIYTVYFSCLIKLFIEFDTIKSKIFIILFFISTTNFILIERFATDILIFIIVFLALNIKKKYIQSILIFFGIVLKYYPVFLTSIFIKDKKYFFANILIFFMFFYFFYLDQFQSENIIEIALIIGYGTRTFAKALYYISVEYDLFINDQNYNFFKNILMLLTALYSLILVIFGYLFSKINSEVKSSKFENYFIGGASIYIGTFIIGANADYRLIFLIFTIPYILNLNNKFIKFFLIFSIIFSINSFLFQHSEYFILSDIKHWIYYSKASFIYFCKFLILSFLSFLIGSYLKKINFIKI